MYTFKAKKINQPSQYCDEMPEAGIDESLPRQRIETVVSVASQLLGELLIATIIVVA
jgi:hypothetical protein